MHEACHLAGQGLPEKGHLEGDFGLIDEISMRTAATGRHEPRLRPLVPHPNAICRLKKVRLFGNASGRDGLHPGGRGDCVLLRREWRLGLCAVVGVRLFDQTSPAIAVRQRSQL